MQSSEQISIQRAPRWASVAAASALVLSACTSGEANDKQPDEFSQHPAPNTAPSVPGVYLDEARDVLANRYTNCTMYNVVPDEMADGSYRMTLELTFDKKAVPLWEEFFADNAVEWNSGRLGPHENGLASRVVWPGSQGYADYPLKANIVAPGTVDGRLVSASYRPGLASPPDGYRLDIFKDESVQANGKTTLNAIFCGAIQYDAQEKTFRQVVDAEPIGKLPSCTVEGDLLDRGDPFDEPSPCPAS